MVQDERKQLFPERMVSFILVNNSISRGQLQYTDYLIYTKNSDDVNAETLQSFEKGHKHMIPIMATRQKWRGKICLAFLFCVSLGSNSSVFFQKMLPFLCKMFDVQNESLSFSKIYLNFNQ